jgi:hypothetical protein
MFFDASQRFQTANPVRAEDARRRYRGRVTFGVAPLQGECRSLQRSLEMFKNRLSACFGCACRLTALDASGSLDASNSSRLQRV